jgi:RecB family exonuclease
LAKQPAHNLITGGFGHLEAEFLRRMDASRAADPLAPAVVLVPNLLLRMHLARRLAESGRPHANLHFLTLHAFALRLAGDRLAREGRKPMPRGLMELFLAGAAEKSAGQLGYFRPVAEREGFQQALLQTFRDLRDACVGPSDLARIMPRLRKREHLHDKLRDLLLLWEKVEAERIGKRFHDGAELLEIAAKEAAVSPWMSALTGLTVYGFYDLTGAQERFLESGFARVPTTVFIPYADGDEHAYAARALKWFREKLAPAAEQALPDDAPPDDLLILSAPNESREAEEAVREVAFPERPGHATYGVLLRTTESYSQPLFEKLSEAGVNGYFTDGPSLARSVAGKSLLALAKLQGGRLRRAEVMDFIGLAPLRGNPPDALWNAISMEAGIVEGRDEWPRRLASKAAYWRREDRDEEDPAARADALKADAADALREFIERLFDGLADISAQSTWGGTADAFGRLFEGLVGPSEDAERVLAALRELSALDAAGVPPTPDRFRRLLEEALDAKSSQGSRFQANEPTVADIEKARGVPFDVVILPGLVEKCFPRPARQDPILFDRERARLQELWAGMGLRVSLPMKGRRPEEERLLFALAVRAARKRLVLTFPRLDSRLERPRIPSHFLLGMIERLTGRAADYRDLDSFVRSDPRGRVIRLTRFDPARRDRSVTAMEYGLSSFAAAERAGDPDALLYLAGETPFFTNVLKSEAARWDSEKYTEYDGLIPPGVLPPHTLYDDRHGTSPTRLERYAACPFDYLMRYVFGLEPVEEPERAIGLSALDRGRIVHDILFIFFTTLAKEGRLPVTEAALPLLESIARRRFERFEREGATGYPMMWEIAKRAILNALDSLLRSEIRKQDGFAPSFFELRFGAGHRDNEESDRSKDAPAILVLPDGSETRFNGKIDRIDVNEAKTLCRVIDYKSGAPGPKLEGDPFCGGRALQLPVYLLAVRQLLPDFKPESALYRHLDFGKGQRDVAFDAKNWEEKRAALAKVVSTLLDGIRSGFFPARPDERLCGFCDFRLACGHGRLIDYKWLADPAARPLRDLEEMP